MKKIILATGLCFLLSNVFSQSNDAATFASGITVAELRKHLTIIASDEMEGRETGTEGQRRAAAYIESQFKSIGLGIPKGMFSYQQNYPLLQDSMVSSNLKTAEYTAVYEMDYIIPRSNTSGQFKSKAVVFAGYGIEDKNYNDYAELDVKDKLVIIVLGEPKIDNNYLVSGTGKSSEWTYPGLAKKISLAQTKGAAGVLVINPSQENFSPRMTAESRRSNLYYPREINDKKINFALITHAFAKKLLSNSFNSILKKATTSGTFAAADAWQKKMDVNYIYQKNTDTIFASNVIGIIEGSDKKDEYVFLTGHYDHLGKRNGKIYYGADDDGSGTVAVIQMAKAFASARAEGKGPRRTVVFMTVSGEEKGLWGSEYYSDHPVYPLEKTSVDLNTDMIGRIDTERKTADTLNYVYVVGHDKLSSELPLINEATNSKFTGLVLDYKFDDPNDTERIYYRSDHYNFARKGVPVLFFYDGMLQADYHKPTDTVDKINWLLYEKRTRMIFHTAWEIANREEMLKRDKPLPTGTR